jgi:hypothetical protein
MKLGEKAKGSLGAVTPEQEKTATALAGELERPDSRFYARVAPDAVPCSCVDGRCPQCQEAAKIELSPNTAGGTLSLWVAARMTNLTDDDWPTFLGKLSADDVPIGGHVDECAGADKSGCGANDKLFDISNFTEKNYDTMTNALGAIEQNVDHNVTREMANKAIELSLDIKNDNPVTRLNALRDAGAKVDTLTGNHGELVAIINKVKGTTLDRFALADKFGTNMTFSIDYWSFENAAQSTFKALDQPTTPETIAKFVTAMTLYNIATSYVLGGPNLQVIVRE